ncbi:hypothetical protein jhhlp_006261 [Lomentospora prolificans]|uniref:Glycosyl transferase CAP10 domain-containing protein n=1 Tax=Lomentospora prolificans TaxID=41688 RepID=A0A2N3N5E9_9PEZI|nr:hypothetical protein jhhlp_006261 [Lomentospora prolificans]
MLKLLARAMMAPCPRRRPLTKPVLVAFAVFVVIYFLVLREARPGPHGQNGASSSSRAVGRASLGTHEELGLTEEDCRNVFPGLMDEIDRAVARGPFKVNIGNDKALIATVRNGDLYIRRPPGKGQLSKHMKERQLAALHQIYRAITSSPTPLPNTTFSLSIHDSPLPNSFVYARPAHDQPSSTYSTSKAHSFPMPHFSAWSWALPFLNSLPAASSTITNLESTLPFSKKNPRAIWRGTPWFANPLGVNPHLRQDLIRVAGKATSWADVQALDWTTNSASASNGLPIQDFCRYKYIIHTEGVSYSGRFSFHRMCRSIILSPPLEWFEPTTHLLRPIYSTVLLRGRSALDKETEKDPRAYPSKRTRQIWPADISLEEANIIFVKPDWTDLEETIAWLEAHPAIAERIAARQRDQFVGGGYVSKSAETCYWRSLLKGWNQVAQVAESELPEGVTFEEFILSSEAH